jgi:arylesterase/paraoxonase
MRRSGSPVGLFLLTLAAGAGAFLYLASVDQSKAFQPRFEGSCSPVAGIAGPEDLQIDPATRQAFIASFDRSAGSKTRGGVFVFSIDDPLADAAWKDRTNGDPARFEPVGLNFYDDGVVRRLFVVNAATDAIELYDISAEGDLTLIESFAERRLTSPNDVAAAGPRSFYVTNDLAAGRGSLLGSLQYLFRTASGSVLHFDGVAWKVAADGLRFANGIALSPNGRRLYVTETAGAALRIFDREVQNGLLFEAETVPVGVAVDNINIDHSGSLWIGARPSSFLPRVAHAPSMVLRYDDMTGTPSKPTPIFTDDGGSISSSTVAARHGPTLLIGAPYEKKFLICRLPT